MSYQDRIDIDRLYDLIYDTQSQQLKDKSEVQILFNQLLERFGFDKPNADKFNFAVITKTEDDIEYQEFWILSNAYYNYDDGYFYKIDMHNTSFGIQIQGKGAFPGEAELGYYDNSGINVWRNPSLENLDWATTEQKRCLVETGVIGEYDSRGNVKTFAVSCGWNNAFMFDSYGGMTIGGTGFEIDGNGIFPYTRVANCLYTNPDDGKEYGYIALLHNAYNSTRYGWDCDSNRTYSWLMGIHAPVDETLGGNNLDLSQADFRVMYNDTLWNSNNTHELDITKWHTVLKVDTNSITGLIDGNLRELGDYNSLKNKPVIELDDSGWIDVPNANLNGNFFNYYTSDLVHYRKLGKTVYLAGTVMANGNLSVGEWQIMNLPEGFRPSREVSALCELVNTTSLWTCTIKTNGDVCFNNLRDGDVKRTAIQWTDVLRFDVSFLI